MKKGQVATEFLLMFLVLSIIFASLFIYISAVQQDYRWEKEQLYLHDFTSSIVNDFYITAQITEGFEKQRNIPATILGRRITVTLQANTSEEVPYILVTTQEHEVMHILPDFSFNESFTTTTYQGGDTIILKNIKGEVEVS